MFLVVLTALAAVRCSSAQSCQSACDEQHPRPCFDAARFQLRLPAQKRDLSLAMKDLRLACTAGITDACFEQSQLLLLGMGARLDPVAAAALMEKGCAENDPWSCAGLAFAYAGADGVPHSLDTARAFFARAEPTITEACKRAEARGCAMVATAHRLRLIPTSPAQTKAAWQKAVPLLVKACEANDAESCFEAADRSARTGPLKPKPMRALLEKGCTLGNVWTCGALGEALKDGIGAPPNKEQARAPLRQACEAGDPIGCFTLSDVLESPEEKKAAASAAGPGLAQYCRWGLGGGCVLAALLPEYRAKAPELLPLGVPQLREACLNDDPWGCQLLSWAQAWNLDPAHDRVAEVTLERRACELNLDAACSGLGKRFEDGRLVPRDPVRAREAYAKACAFGRAQDCERATALAKAAAPSSPRASCAPGQLNDELAPWKCCWPGQVFSDADARCVGAPRCPAERVVQGEGCSCAGGRSDTADGHCCWPGQRFEAGACTGMPSSCPQTHFLSSGACQPLPSCTGGFVATQATQGRCCWPGQRAENQACVGRPSSCPGSWVPSADGCVPGIADVWPYLRQSLQVAPEVTAPLESSLQYYTRFSSLHGGPGCTVTVVDQKVSAYPRAGISPVKEVITSRLDLAKATAIGLSAQQTDGFNRPIPQYFFHVTTGAVSQAIETTEPPEPDFLEDGRVTFGKPKVEHAARTENALGYFVSFPGGGRELVKAFTAAARACGATPEVLVASDVPGGDLGQEQQLAQGRLQSQSVAWATGHAQLLREYQEHQQYIESLQASTPRLSDAIIAGLQQGQRQVAEWNATLSSATNGLAIVPPASPVFAPPPAPVVLPENASESEIFLAALAQGQRQVAQMNTAAGLKPAGTPGSSGAGAGSRPTFEVETVTQCTTCPAKRCSAEQASCQAGTMSACYEAAACICQCHFDLGGCGSTGPVLQQCVAENRAKASQFNSSSSHFAPGASAPAPTPSARPPPATTGCQAPSGQHCWFAPSDDICPTFESLESCSKGTGHRCVVRTGTAGPAC